MSSENTIEYKINSFTDVKRCGDDIDSEFKRGIRKCRAFRSASGFNNGHDQACYH